jgi:hypothetical protein
MSWFLRSSYHLEKKPACVAYDLEVPVMLKDEAFYINRFHLV